MQFPPGRRSLAGALVVLVLLVVPTAASPAGQIVLFGADSGSHLTLTVEGNAIVAKGAMADAAPGGCRISNNRLRAVCPLSGASSVELIMGSSPDFVEVADPLPISLTAHLGDGSDKFLGNAESDTCLSEGSRRNRCVGGAGDDVCITGLQNSDCVGGPGNDYCRHQFGSDGCWGGPGDDVCVMGPGQDGCHGEAGNDRLYGGRSADRLYGGPGYDFCDGGPGRGKSQSCDVGPQR